jgi:hypothetical protein
VSWSIFVGWNQDQMNMVGHQHPAQYLDFRRRAVFAQEV